MSKNNTNSTQEHLELTGVVIEIGHGTYKVKVGDNHIINAKLSGKLRINKIRIIPEDTVCVKVSPYDMGTGFIVRRCQDRNANKFSTKNFTEDE